MIKFNQKAKLAVNRDSEEWKTVCQTNTLVSQKTPVLYSTSRGIHLRTYKGNIYKLEHSYEFQVCDLERWSVSFIQAFLNYSQSLKRITSQIIYELYSICLLAII